MNMKKSFIGILAATIILSGCGTSQMAAGDPNAVLAGGSCHCQCSHSPPKAGGVQLPDRKDTALSPAIRKTAASIGHRPLEDTEYTFH